MSNIKNADLQPANTVDELFTELTNEELSQVSGGASSFWGDFSDFLEGVDFTYTDSSTNVSVKDKKVAVSGK